MAKYTVNLEQQSADSEDEQAISWTGEAMDAGHAADLAQEEYPDAEVSVVFEEED